jgi:hypothetical protein
MRANNLAVWAAFSAMEAAAQSPAPAIATIDVYGSSTFDSARARAELRPLIEDFVALSAEAQSNPNADMAELQARGDALEARMREALGDPPLAHFEVSMTTDFGPPQRLHVSLDIVEQQDAARRMPFRAAPTADLPDPDGLLALWAEYQAKVLELAFAGTPLRVDAGECPALHCIAPFDVPELAPYLALFDDGARRHEDALYRLAAESADAEERQHALFLLAHTNDAERVLPALGDAIYDPAGGVRNNAMRVLMFLAESRPELDFPVSALVAALDFPGSSDRNKAGYTLAALAAQPRYRDAVRAAVPTALRVLRLEKPNNHDPAYEILKLVSGETFGDRDYAAWERWAAQSR